MRKGCLECGKFLPNEKRKFCSSSCAAKYNNKKYPKRKKKEQICKNCEKLVEKYNNKFCNTSCFNEYVFRTETLPRFYKGEIHNNATLRKVLIHIKGENCSECNQLPIWNNKLLVIQVDHIDGDSDNNLPENLRLLCPNCHTQTETYCAGNHKNTKRNSYLRKYKKLL